MIFVECAPDALLVEALMGHHRRDIIHGSKGELCNKLRKKRGSKAMTDEDPSSSQPRYIDTLHLQVEFPDEGLKLLRDNSNNNLVIVLYPKLEDWILRSARLAGIDIANYGLPHEPKKLHEFINPKLDEFRNLVEALKEKKSKSLNLLKKLLETKQ